MIYQNVDVKRLLASLQHTDAFAVTRPDGKRASMRALAKQMGRSELMIQQHYRFDEIVGYLEELRSDKPVISSPKCEAS